MGALLGLWIGGCGPARVGSTAAPRTVILLSIDTLRPDHLGCYGYRLPTSPHLDRFRGDAVLFSQAIAAAPSTLPSHASIMTSLLPQQHGATHTVPRALSPRLSTLASLFHRQGYRTVSFNDGAQLAPEFGLGHGFDAYVSSPRGSRYRFAEIVDRAIDWMRSHPDGPLFLFLHTYEVHHPYQPDPGDLALMEPRYDGVLPATETPIQTLVDVNHGRIRIGARDRAHIVATYDAGIRTMDAAFGRLVAYLEQTGLYGPALIAVTSDHGEELGEHGMMGWHAHTLYDELLRVPLLIKFPGAAHAGETVGAQVRGIDVAPTLLAAANQPVPEQFCGADLGPLISGRPDRPRFAVSRRDSTPDTSIRSADWKLYDGRLFDLHGDPGETHDVAARYPAIVALLGRELRALVAERPATAGIPRQISAAERERLRALGYV